MNRHRYIIEASMSRIGSVTLDRPGVHNALHIEMIRELSDAFRSLSKNKKLQLIIIDSNGENFSAGADLNWMKNGLEQSKEELTSESEELAQLFHTIYTCPIVTLAVARGKVIGGANGIIAAADISIAAPGTTFAFSEVKLGLIPATIAPYVVARTGKSVAREWMLTGRQIPAREAYERGLVDMISEYENPNTTAQLIMKTLLNNGPQAMKGIKEMFRNDDLLRDPGEQLKSMAKLIAQYRVSKEGQEGIQAFFEKRKPEWSND